MSNTFLEHIFEYRSVERNKLILSIAITLIFMIVELVGGFVTRSIALISDAGHMFTHSFAIGISLFAIIIARNPPCHHKTFGLHRAEVLAAFTNGLFLLLVVSVIVYETILRIINPVDILATEMLLIAAIGLVVNLTSIFILQGSNKEDLNIRGLFYHMIADASSSVGIIIAAIVIYFTGWNLIDPLVSLFISAVILHWAWGILRESTLILLEMTPRGLTTDTVKEDLKLSFPEIVELNNIHLWTITPEIRVFSTHMKVTSSFTEQKNLISAISEHLREKYNILESTIQISLTEEAR